MLKTYLKSQNIWDWYTKNKVKNLVQLSYFLLFGHGADRSFDTLLQNGTTLSMIKKY